MIDPAMVKTGIIFAYLAAIIVVGVLAFRRGKGSGEDFFLASRSLGSWIFLLSLFGTNMTAFAILGSSGMSYSRGIGVFGLMASSSGLVIPFTLLFIGTRLWWMGKKFGHMTQVDYFRDRWQCGTLGTCIFALTAAMLVPYIIIALIGGGKTLEELSTYQGADGLNHHLISYAVGASVVVLAVSLHIFLGGMRGAAWVNTFQTILFLVFGTIAVLLIGNKLGGYGHVMDQLAASKNAALLARDRISQREFFSYLFIPLSSIMFPHMAIMCLSAKKMSAFKKTVVAYPICIMLIWLPAVFLGVVAAFQFPGLNGPGQADNVIMRLLNANTEPLVTAFLGAGIMSCIMSSDSHQILGLVTMFTRDIVRHYGGEERFGPQAQAWIGRVFVVVISVIAYVLALTLKDKAGIFELAIRFAFSGFAALAPVMVAALFWKRSTAAGAFAAVVWVAATSAFSWWLHEHSAPLAATLTPAMPPAQIFPALGDLFLRTKGGVTIYGFLPVVPMCIGSALLIAVVSLLTKAPRAEIIAKYFPAAGPDQAAPALQGAA